MRTDFSKMKYKKPDMVNVFIVNENKHALIINNIKHGTSRWEFPGGKVEKGISLKGFGLEAIAIKEAEEELGIDIGFTKPPNSHIFGDYETQTPEGDFLCRTYFAKIIKGEPRIMEPKIHGGFEYASYSKLLRLNDAGILVPNLVLALPKLREYVM